MGYTKEQREAKASDELNKDLNTDNDDNVGKANIRAKKKPVLSLDDRILIRNGYHGKLVVKFPKAGYTITLNSFGDEDYIELVELKSLRSSDDKYFKQNWILFDDIEVIKFLHLEPYYNNALSIEDFDEFFTLTIDEMKLKINELSNGQKKVIAYKAIDMINDGSLDSVKTIKALEELLGYELIEK